jgi:hypothetical protein
MRRAAMLVAAAAVMLGTNLAAQAPNLTGTWTMVVDPNAPPPQGRGGGGGFGMTFAAVQDAKTLTITRTTQNGEVKSVYNLDGSDSKNMMQGRGGATEQVSHAKWDGPKLVITRTQNMGGNDVTITQSLWLDASGNLMVSTSRPGQDGTPVTTTVTYKKG